MKTSSGTGPVKRSAALTCLLMNQFATPGLGSLMARRFVAGAIQLSLAIIGFAMFLGWFVALMLATWRAAGSDSPAPMPVPWLLIAGINIFVISWLLAWFTSISVWREARGKPPELSPRAVPPKL